MSDQLFGKEVSGTSLETRGLAGETSGEFSNLISSPEQGASRISEMFGIDLSQLGLQEGFQDLFSGAGASKSFAAFDEANRPFQQRALSESRSRGATQFGTAGGRFSRNLFGAGAASDARLEQGFDQNRLQFAQAQRGQDLQALLGTVGAIPGLQQASLSPLIAAGQFAAPGAPIFQEGFLGDLIGGGATLASPFLGAFGSSLFGAGARGSRGVTRDQFSE